MDIDDIIRHVASLDGVLTLRPQPGDGSPQISWGDTFFYYAPDGQLPNGQPFATVVTKAYPDEHTPQLDDPGAFRLNIAVGQDTMQELLGPDPAADASAADTWTAHPVYGHLGWVAVINPGERTSDQVSTLLRSAHAQAQARQQRRETLGQE